MPNQSVLDSFCEELESLIDEHRVGEALPVPATKTRFHTEWVKCAGCTKTYTLMLNVEDADFVPEGGGAIVLLCVHCRDGYGRG